jgi:hypothetical protein
LTRSQPTDAFPPKPHDGKKRTKIGIDAVVEP